MKTLKYTILLALLGLGQTNLKAQSGVYASPELVTNVASIIATNVVLAIGNTNTGGGGITNYQAGLTFPYLTVPNWLYSESILNAREYDLSSGILNPMDTDTIDMRGNYLGGFYSWSVAPRAIMGYADMVNVSAANSANASIRTKAASWQGGNFISGDMYLSSDSMLKATASSIAGGSVAGGDTVTIWGNASGIAHGSLVNAKRTQLYAGLGALAVSEADGMEDSSLEAYMGAVLATLTDNSHDSTFSSRYGSFVGVDSVGYNNVRIFGESSLISLANLSGGGANIELTSKYGLLVGSLKGGYTNSFDHTIALLNESGVAAAITTNGFFGNGAGLTNLSVAVGNVAYATNAGSAGYATNAGNASYATNALGASYATNWTGLASSNAYAGSFTGNSSGLTNLQATNLVGTLPMGTLTSQSPLVTNGFLTTDGSARTYSKDGQYLTNLSAASVVGVHTTLTNSGTTGCGDDLKLGPLADFTMDGGNLTVTGLVHTFMAAGAATLVVTNNRVGAGTATPVYAMDVNGDVRGDQFRVGYSSAQGRLTHGSFTNHASSLIISAAANCALTLGANARFADLIVVSNGWVGINTNIPQSQFHANGTITSVSNVVQSTLTAGNVALSAPRYKDTVSSVYWTTGAGIGNSVTSSIPIVTMPDGTQEMMFTATNGQSVTSKSESLHEIANTNSAYTASTLYWEPHAHICASNQPTTGTNCTLEVIWTARSPAYGTNVVRGTNRVNFVLTNAVERVAELGHVQYGTFHPGIASTWTATWRQVGAGSNDCLNVIISCPNIHIPTGLQSIAGSASDNAP